MAEPQVTNSRKPSLRRQCAVAGRSLGAIILVVEVLILLFGGAILNRYAKPKAERAFAAAHPGYAVQIGKLNYALAANRLVAQSVTLRSTSTTLKAGRVLLTGVRWPQVLWGTAALAEVLANASFEATNLDLEFPESHYGIRCARLRASVPASELIAEGTELRPLGGDEAFFAAHIFRTPLFHVTVPESKVMGLAYREMFAGKAFRARSVHFSDPSFDALINRDKLPEPFVKSPLLVHEALAAIPQPVQIGTLSVTNGHLTYRERLVVRADPAVLTFGQVSLVVDEIANRGTAPSAIQLRGQGDLMNAATMKVQMTIPILVPDFSLHYSGSLTAMDLTRLDAFLEIAESSRIKSGNAQAASFEIDVTNGLARGWVRATYADLKIALLDKKTGNESGLVDRASTFLAKELKFRKANPPEGLGSRKEGVVSYTRRPDDEFQQFAWFALRTGVLDIITH